MLAIYLRRKPLWRRVWDKLSGRDRRARLMVERLRGAISRDREEIGDV